MAGVGEDPIDAAVLLRAVADPACGAQALFLGVVRNHDGRRAVTGVTYDCFRPLADKELSAILRETAARGVRVAAAHRVGRLGVGEASLAVAVAAAHRQEAFEACRWIVDEIKRRLPVWKQEHYADGGSAWKDGCVLEAR